MLKTAPLFSALACTVLLIASVGSLYAEDTFSPAEQLLFLSDHLSNVSQSAVISYSYAKKGTLDPAAQGNVNLSVSPMSSGEGKHVHVDFLSESRKFELPDIDNATANPVILFFLERDVRDMQRRTGGQASYFRKRVRMALAESAAVEPIEFDYQGHSVNGTRITIQPFNGDPLRSRFEQLADKSYVFMLSQAVPGQLYRMQTQARKAQAGADAAPVLEETITLIGVQP
jgi:hypothetical protein